MEASLNQCKMDENRLATRVNLVERHVLSNSGDWHILGSKYIHFGIDKFFRFWGTEMDRHFLLLVLESSVRKFLRSSSHWSAIDFCEDRAKRDPRIVLKGSKVVGVGRCWRWEKVGHEIHSPCGVDLPFFCSWDPSFLTSMRLLKGSKASLCWLFVLDANYQLFGDRR